MDNSFCNACLGKDVEIRRLSKSVDRLSGLCVAKEQVIEQLTDSSLVPTTSERNYVNECNVLLLAKDYELSRLQADIAERDYTENAYIKHSFKLVSKIDVLEKELKDVKSKLEESMHCHKVQLENAWRLKQECEAKDAKLKAMALGKQLGEIYSDKH